MPAGLQARFFTAVGLATAYAEAREEHHPQRLQNNIFKRHLIIMDERGYVPLGQRVAENLSNFIRRCYERTSLIVTTNLPFSEWPQVLGNERIARTLLDRLTHRVHVLEMDGESYWLKADRRTTRNTARENGTPEEEQIWADYQTGESFDSTKTRRYGWPKGGSVLSARPGALLLVHLQVGGLGGKGGFFQVFLPPYAKFRRLLEIG